jgi:L-lactate utilization protein LutB
LTRIPYIQVLEPAAVQRQRQAAGIVVGKETQLDLESIKAHLKEIRQDARERHAPLFKDLKKILDRYPEVKVCVAADAKEAASYIRHIAGKDGIASINKSSVVVNELRPELNAAGLKTYIRYFSEFKNLEKFEKKIDDYWDLPGLHERGLLEWFGITHIVHQLNSSQTRDYVALLGVNAISAEDGSVFFLQHMSNIYHDIEQAEKVVLVVSLDKILPNKEAAFFHTKAMGIFGLESVLLDLAPHHNEEYNFDNLPLAGDHTRELHLLILDNGRSELLNNGYEDLFLCIDCRACARQCPIGKHLLVSRGMSYSPKNYLLGFLQGWLPSIEACLHCGRCEVECPVDIDIPALLWQSQIDYYARRGRSWKKKMLDDPEFLAKIGSWTAPLANWAKNRSIVKLIMQSVAGIHRKAHLPTFHRQTLQKWDRGGRHG